MSVISQIQTPDGTVHNLEGLVNSSGTVGNKIAWEKNNNVVTVRIKSGSITKTSSGYHELGTLPSGCRPSEDIQFCCYDRDATSQTRCYCYYMTISTGGIVRIYVFSDVLTVNPVGVVTYIVAA